MRSSSRKLLANSSSRTRLAASDEKSLPSKSVASPLNMLRPRLENIGLICLCSLNWREENKLEWCLSIIGIHIQRRRINKNILKINDSLYLHVVIRFECAKYECFITVYEAISLWCRHEMSVQIRLCRRLINKLPWILSVKLCVWVKKCDFWLRTIVTLLTKKQRILYFHSKMINSSTSLLALKQFCLLEMEIIFCYMRRCPFLWLYVRNLSFSE